MQSVYKRILTACALAGTLCSMGCTSLKREQDVLPYLIPANMAAGYFGAVATHEGAHALTAAAQGGKKIRVRIIPDYDDQGKTHFGLTSYTTNHPPSGLETTLFNTSGPASMFVAQAATRELLKTNTVPRFAQPTLQWYAVANKIGYYYHSIRGLARDKNADLGKEALWVPITFLAAGLAYDVYDFCSDSPQRYVGVLGGQEFYEEKQPRLQFMMMPEKKGGFFGFRFEF